MHLRSRRLLAVLFSLGLLLLTGFDAFGQTNQEVNAGLQLNLANPGARSLALGGAFLGLADDATAAFSNPAGLTNLSKPELSAEGRHWNYRTSYLNGGGPPPAPFNYSRSNDDANGLSFASFVFPGKNWAVALYRHEQAHFVANINTQGTKLGLFGTPPVQFYARPIDGRSDVRITNFGGSIAVRLGEALSLGASVVASQYNQKIKDTRYDATFDSNGNIVGRGAVNNYDSATGEQTKVTVNVGVLWKPTRVVSLGAVYRRGPKFDLSYKITLADRTTTFPDTTPCQVSSSQQCAIFHVPDVYGAGVSVRPTDFLTVSVDYDRVRYSQLTDKFTDISVPANSVNYNAKDSNEVHFGVQYTIPVGSSVIALRAGLWHDPAHGVRYTGETTTADQVVQSSAFTGGKSEMHYAGGLGLVIGEHVQIDGAYDSAPAVRTASASIVVRF